MKQAKILPVFLVCCVLLIGLAGYSIVTTLFGSYNPERYITLPNYKNITISDPTSQPTEDEIEASMSAVIAQFSTTETVTGEAGSGDTVTLDYTGKIDGDQVDAFSGTDATATIGNDDFLVTGIDPYLEGCQTGDTITASLTVQDGYHLADYIGETVDFTLTVTNIQRTVVPELNDQFAQQLGYDTVEEFRTAFYDKYQEERELENKATLRNALWQEVIDTTTVESYPQKELTQLVDDFTAQVQAGAKEYEMEFLDYASFAYGVSTQEELDEYALTYSESVLKQQMILKAIAKREDLSITDQLYEQYVTEYLALYEEEGYTEEDLLEIFDGEEGLREQFLMEEVTDVIEKYATVNQ